MLLLQLPLLLQLLLALGCEDLLLLLLENTSEVKVQSLRRAQRPRHPWISTQINVTDSYLQMFL